ncbi:pyrroline-5-carboxylate reductase [Stappia sp. F7233]|uniref:Pyrroline-5-carboxylate reductase n=1 Tax=Stappia albiluteola TaxID=2758565 RepID=A0A839A9Z6_9HYPH|nr:pyrroline-5-carboxylate reductase [Stappia albiluteola]MBA5775762.1 pyrroline-5-carboxylate reductase [Stappia albiluteola]
MTQTAERPLALIGAGKMGGAMLEGWVKRGADPRSIVVVDPKPAPEMSDLLARHGIGHETALSASCKPGILLLAIKPQLMERVLPTLTPSVLPDTLVLSIAAGTTVATLGSAFGDVPIVRVMPNTPAQVGRGMSVAYANDKVVDEQRREVDLLLSAIGMVAWADAEDQMDAVTAVSGSGPAYVFHLVEALAAAGVKAGLPAELARVIARQTVVGAGELLHQSELDAGTLRENVTSPNGTTAAALSVLMAPDGLGALMEKAVAAATRRSRELAG